MKYKVGFLVFLWIFMIILTGCSKSAELHQKSVIQGIAIDLDDSEYRITVQTLDFKNPVGKDEPSIKIIELRGRTLSEALESISQKSGLIPMYSQNTIIIIGEDAAKSGVKGFMDFFVRHYETRPNVKICVCESFAYDILSKKIDDQIVKAQDISDLIPQDFHSDVLHFMGRLNTDVSDPYCAYLKKEGDNDRESAVIKGIAVFSGDKMINTFEGEDFLGALLVLGIKYDGAYNIKVDRMGTVSLEISKVKSKINFNKTQNQFIANTYVSINILEANLEQGVKIGNNEQEQIEKQFALQLSNICKQTINKSINLRSDIFRFGKVLMNTDTDYFRLVSDNLKENMRTFDYVPNINAKIELTGSEI